MKVCLALGLGCMLVALVLAEEVMLTSGCDCVAIAALQTATSWAASYMPGSGVAMQGARCVICVF
jgi:hypothetical protein